MFLKKYQSHTHILTISNGMNTSLLPPCFSVLEMYIQRLNYQVFPMKTRRAFKILTKCVENNWEGNRVRLGGRKFECTLTKEPQNCSSPLCDMGLPCSKLNNSNLIKDRNIIFAVSKRYINILRVCNIHAMPKVVTPVALSYDWE